MQNVPVAVMSRRNFLTTATTALALPAVRSTAAQAPVSRVEVLNPAGRVPLSFVIDDSTCLVNMGHFCTPQFAAAFPKREEYKRPWQTWPREIPDSFVREFGEWCAEHGVKGKYSIVPYPACVGWMDRDLPGWTRQQRHDSLKLVRDLMVPNWDIHPEMITHTLVIDLKTGRPFPEIGPATIENSFPQTKRSVDEIAAYMAYALKILKNCGLPCEGITTPGGFGNIMKPELGLAVQQAVSDIFSPEIPHYFKYVHAGSQSTLPILEHVSGRGTDDLKLTVNVPAGTGDWFGGWQGVNKSEGHKYCNEDATAGRMVELIERGEPAVMLCHWPGMYCNGTKDGFRQFQQVVTSLHSRFADQTIWMKLSEIARYYAAKELTEIEVTGEGIQLSAPFDCPSFTLSLPGPDRGEPVLANRTSNTRLKEVQRRGDLTTNSWCSDRNASLFCVDLKRGESIVEFT